MTVYASWNGATEVVRWQVRSGTTRADLKAMHTARRTGFETAMVVPAALYVSVAALDAKGGELGVSQPLAV
jgi:hypothetical protein